MDQRESDPTGAFSGDSAGTDRPTTPAGERGRGDGPEPVTDATGVESSERERVIEGMAATSEIADPVAQAHAEDQGHGTTQQS